MACLRRETLTGRSGTVRCSEEGCELRLVASQVGRATVVDSSTGDCVLQLRLRAGDVEEPGVDHTNIGPIALEPGEAGYVPVKAAPGVCDNCRSVQCDGTCTMSMPDPVEAIREWQKQEWAEWDASKGTNPETCRHWVISRYIGYLKYNWICFSCGLSFVDIPFDRKLEDYRYDPKSDSWEFRRKNTSNPVPERGAVEELLGYELFDWQWDMLVHVFNKAPIRIYRGRKY